MSGVQIEYFLGIFFMIEGIAGLTKSGGEKLPDVVRFIAGVVLIFLALAHFALV